MQGRLSASDIILALILQAAAIAYAYDLGQDVTLCWRSNKSISNAEPERVDCEGAKVAYTINWPSLYAGDVYNVTFSVAVPSTIRHPPSLIQTTGGLHDIVHANVHSCFRAAGFCSPFVKPGANVATHSPEVFCTRNTTTKACDAQTPVVLDVGSYSMIAHARWIYEGRDGELQYDLARAVFKTVKPAPKRETLAEAEERLANCRMRRMSGSFNMGGSSQARTSMPMKFTFDPGRMTFGIDPKSGGDLVSITAQYSLSWSDNALLDPSASCASLWLPEMVPAVKNPRESSLLGAQFVLGEGPNVTMHASHRFTFSQDWNHVTYPFDTQTTVFSLKVVPSADLTTCADVYHEIRAHKGQLLHSTSSFILARDDRSTIHSAHMPAPPSSNANHQSSLASMPRVDLCEIRIKLERQPLVFTVTSLMPEAIIVTAGLLAIHLDPKVPPLLSGRCSLLAVGILIIINKSSTRTIDDIGRRNYLLLLDLFSLVNIFFLLLLLIETISVFKLIQQDKFEYKGIGATVDRACRRYMAVLYLLICIGFAIQFTVDLHQVEEICLAYWTISMLAYIMISGFLLYTAIKRHTQKMEHLVQQVRMKLATDQEENEDEAHALLDAIFESIDESRDGSIDRKEITYLLRAMYPNVSDRVFDKVAKEVCPQNKKLDRLAFDDILPTLHEAVMKHVETLEDEKDNKTTFGSISFVKMASQTFSNMLSADETDSK
mmetsp:Transcript_59090/g.97793  ORF Transcript_59090/g.97793 Transcript_59090/m.97793 type:complete len:718 (+) Transcript_59090:79-2232(+)